MEPVKFTDIPSGAAFLLNGILSIPKVRTSKGYRDLVKIPGVNGHPETVASSLLASAPCHLLSDEELAKVLKTDPNAARIILNSVFSVWKLPEKL